MAKLQWKPSTILNPVPVTMVTCADAKGAPNIITIAWAGTVNSDPPMVSISVRPERYSHGLIAERKEFVINLVTRALVRAADFCGVKSGRTVDKFKMAKLTAEPASVVDVPLIAESPVNIECRVDRIIPLGSHDMFLARIVAVNVDEGLIDAKGKLCLDRAGLACYNHGDYCGLGRPMGYFGYSVRRRKKLKRNR
ncbi:MAG TPA: flavin reductase family protein [Spirochaetota bacterium]|nr:flavin reductase family protein [Spirochaetota bacterium]HPC41546.1 flavin reductase family protein [Spirochaetota bacterium]HPL16943.1 flavin reductase family protein [Spirochaetota bacterium]HQF09085.1 flavin reductase family protein [Spirochaetota bacterium]HQH97690.1 flavin reductase family protein [Spirochaetota bacterium]